MAEKEKEKEKEGKRCKRCHAPLKDDYRYCPACGAPCDEERYDAEQRRLTALYGPSPLV